MLILKDIVKDYITGDTTVRAMKNISINFRESEFVAILGPSGCGKTTMLNIIGGLDKYTSGDLIINGKSTKAFKDADWDTYRNHSIGFVFQSYNLIPHQTVLSNVELALTLTGVSPKERREKAVEALEKVGLREQINKKPSQLSGGQMQRVAIARALINNPDIILADEPTGALDSETSVQIMELLKEISHDKLIIMVTHNPDLAYKYANRIISCMDGAVVNDSNPFEPARVDFEKEKQKANEEKAKGKKPSMKMRTAFLLSLKNLITKKGRTIMVAFAGSIGIVGIALILALSNGINGYIDRIESDALMMFPMSVEKEATDMDSVLETALGLNPLMPITHGLDKVYTNKSFSTLLTSFISQSSSNNLSSFKKYIDDNKEKFAELCGDIQYNYTTRLNLYRVDDNSNIKVNPSTLMRDMNMEEQFAATGDFIDIDSYTNLWRNLVGDEETFEDYYDIIYGSYPKSYNEALVIVDGNNEINEMMLYALGITDQSQAMNDIMSALSGNIDEEATKAQNFTYEEICNLKYKLLLNSDLMLKDEKTGLWSNQSENPLYIKSILENGVDIKIVGIGRPSKDNVLSIGTGFIGYTTDLMDYAMEKTAQSKVVQEQLKDTSTDILTGEKFVDYTVNDFDLADIDLNDIDYNKLDITPFLSMADEIDMSKLDITDISSLFDFGDMSTMQKKLMEGYLTDEQVLAFKKAYLETMKEKCSLENTFEILGYSDEDSPTSIFIYPRNFDTKRQVMEMVDYYNEEVTSQNHKELTINCTDYVGIIMDLASQAINIVTYTLILFVSISLVVSSIMIGIITYVSVIERTKEIGILRSIGASKKDVSNVFNAETVIIGLSAGFVGILITVLLEIPINLILNHFTGTTVGAVLPFKDGVILIAISIMLTLIAGIVPSRAAAGKDPVEALRSE